MSLSMEIAEDDGLAQFHQWLAILPENASELTLAAGPFDGSGEKVHLHRASITTFSVLSAHCGPSPVSENVKTCGH